LDQTTTNISSTNLHDTFEQLFKSHFTPLCMFSRKYVNDLDVAKDIVHNVFIDLWDKRETVDFSKPMKSYLFTSVHNRSLNHVRDNKKFTRDLTPLEHAESLENTDVNALKNEIELEEKLSTALNILPGKCKEVFMLSRFEGLKYKDIAEKLDISVKTVETQMTKALKMLREHLKDYLVLLILIIISFFLK
jgi:RNA polymerase sigma-70 factor (ECF subfamily)